MHTAEIKNNAIFHRSNNPKDTHEVKLPIIGCRKVRIAQQIIHTIAVDLARDQLHHLFIGISVVDNTSHLVRKRSEEHTSELQSRQYLVCRLLLEKKTNKHT